MQKRQRFPHGITVREGAEIFTFRMLSATMHRQPRVRVAAQKDKRIGLVIAQQNVVARLIQLNVVVLKEQRFRFRMRYGDINVVYKCDQRFGFTGGKVAAEIAGKAFLQIFRLTDIDNRTASIVHTVDAWLAGDGFQKCF